MYNFLSFLQIFITSVISVYIFPIAKYLNQNYGMHENIVAIIIFIVAVLLSYFIQLSQNNKSEYGKYSKFVEYTNNNYSKFELTQQKFDSYIKDNKELLRKIERLINSNYKRSLDSISMHIDEMQDELIDRIRTIDQRYSNKIDDSLEGQFREDLNKLIKYTNIKLHTLSEVSSSVDEVEDKAM